MKKTQCHYSISIANINLQATNDYEIKLMYMKILKMILNWFSERKWMNESAFAYRDNLQGNYMLY